VTYRDTAPADGWCDARSKTIAVGARLAVNRQFAVLVHEIGHALGIDYERYRREVAEVLVDTVTYVVCGGVGLDVGGEAIPYVAGWGEHEATSAVTRFAETIDQIARRIEAALSRSPAGAQDTDTSQTRSLSPAARLTGRCATPAASDSALTATSATSYAPRSSDSNSPPGGVRACAACAPCSRSTSTPTAAPAAHSATPYCAT
jgi:hypothetical protein